MENQEQASSGTVTTELETSALSKPTGLGGEGQTDFDAVAAEYDESLPHHVLDHYLEKRKRYVMANARPGAKILDVGCGTGNLAQLLVREGYDVTGADPFQGMLDVMVKNEPRITAVHAQGQHLPFEDDTFDFTYCVAVMHHVADPKDVYDTLVEMVRVTKPGGKIMVWDHNPRNPYWPILMKRVPQDTGEERLIPEKEVIKGLTAGGATIVSSKALGLMPDFMPKPLLPVAKIGEALVEKVPVVNMFCSHNVVMAIKNAK